MGPLCWLWNIVEKAANSNEQSVNASLNGMQKFIEKVVLMLGQSSNTVTYHRRYNLLNNLMGSSNQAKESLKEKKDLLQKHDGNLPGKKLRNHIVEVIKTRKTTIEAFSAEISQKEPFPEVSQRKHQQRGKFAGRQNSQNEQGTERTSAIRDRDNDEERSNISDRSHTVGVYKLAISCGEKRRRSMYNDKFEGSKFFRSLRALRNGKFEFTAVSPQERRSYDQARFEGCLLLRASPQGISKICSILMGWETLQVHLPLFWSGSCTTNIHGIIESASSITEKVKDPDNHDMLIIG